MTDSQYKLWSFHGGLHLPGHKKMSTGQPIGKYFIPERLILPLQQNIGEPSEPIVSEGEYVLKGQLIARANGYISAPLHAPTSGTVSEITEQLIPHPSGLAATCIIIKSDGLDKWVQLSPHASYENMDPSALRNRIRDAGIVGLGGAGFPSFIKLNPGSRTSIDELVINAAECEPYITCDDMLMREHADEIIQGTLIMQHALHARQCLIGVEDDKPEALKVMSDAVKRLGHGQIKILAIPTLYPTGGEKQIIKVLTGKEAPSQGLPLDTGTVCHNVGTAAAVYQAVIHGRPLVSRIITLTGQGIKTPGNHEVLIGTPVNEFIEHNGGYHNRIGKLIMGGPMMGISLASDLVPVIKTTNCLLGQTQQEATDNNTVMPCIRCGACMDACPVNLLPQQLYWYAFARDMDKIQDYNLFDCIECGCCCYVCPSNIPLVQYYRFAKTEIWAQEREKKKSDRARNRHEFRLERLEKQKKERGERLRKKKAALNKSKSTDKKDNDKQQAIAAALTRVREKQKQHSVISKNTDNLTADQKKKIEDADKRRQQNNNEKVPSEEDSDS
ncbi:MAG TPA: electron transport complex subunit RsxC [Gammaproteobacteria bacterium]|nr:electron transport complex subunit RsxC [Gammaproteobacteria bacterium]